MCIRDRPIPMTLSILSDATLAIGAFAYPAMQTIKVMKERPSDSDETMQWLVYWIIVAAVYLLDCTLGAAGVYEYVPLWNELKLVAFLWLMIPSFQGALWIYLKFLKPVVSK
eukprot:TRINITY_DN6005_c0_g1_i2.p1 TRINITY_DN6005_c0_g1~~TRINITY_DN6005_c0_g1_i2.p1  ORF type:complete len:112 (+),score=19.80 TRINITY_DN6005_c0_g1_i2:152-487(+)